jgi:energy-coupling factor transporter transmembrane protein EcfT
VKKVVIHEIKQQFLPKRSYNKRAGLLVLIGFIALTLLLNNLIGIISLFILLILLTPIVKPPLTLLFKRLLYFAPFIIATFLSYTFLESGRVLFFGISYEGVKEGLFLSSKLLLGILGALVFACSTNKLEIADSLDWLTFRKLKLYIITVLAINSFENIIHIIKVIRLRRGKKKLSNLLSAILSNSMRKGEKLAYSLRTRGYNSS